MNFKTQRRLFGALGARGLTNYRMDIMIDYTNGQHTSTSVLNDGHALILINDIEAGRYDWVKTGAKENNTPPPAPSEKDTQETRNKLRRRIISIFIEMGAVKGDGRADMPFIYSLVLKHWKARFNDIPAGKLAEIIAVLSKEWLPNFHQQQANNPDHSIKKENNAGLQSKTNPRKGKAAAGHN